MKNSLKIVASLMAGLALALSAANHFFDFWRRSLWTQIGLWVGLTLAAAVTVFMIGGWLAKRRQSDPPAGRLARLSGCLLISLLIIVLVPGFTPLVPHTHELVIRATGQKNPASGGSELHLTRFRLDEEAVSFEVFSQHGIWQMTPGEMVSDRLQPAWLEYHFRHPSQGKLQLVFAAGPAGGETEVSLDGVLKQVDLYDLQPDKKKVLNFEVQNTPDSKWVWPLKLADILALGALFILVTPPLPGLERRLPGAYKTWAERLLNGLEQFLEETGRGTGALAQKLRRAALVGLVNLAVFLVLVYIFEAALGWLDPRRQLPPDGKIDGAYYSWGRQVINNSDGFREDEISESKPANACRIMVLGDSLTWGQGLAVEERYTDLLEGMLQERYPQKQIEVLNFGIQGLSTLEERDFLSQYKRRVEPDQVVVGFCYNDPQPHSQDYRDEKALYNQRHPFIATGLPAFMEKIYLKQLAERYRAGLETLLIRLNIIPDWTVGLDRTYQPDSKEWRAFTGALADIKQISDEAGLPSPLFAVLSQGSYPDQPVNLSDPDSYQQYILKWSGQAEQAAAQAGFQAFNAWDEIGSTFANEPMGINALDGHPNAKANQVYAEKLFTILVERIEAGQLCK